MKDIKKKKNIYLAYYQPKLKQHLKEKLSKHKGESNAFG